MIRHLPTRTLALAVLAAAAGAPALAVAEAPRHCVLLASAYETRGVANSNVTDALRASGRVLQARLLQRLQADKLVVNGVAIDVDSRVIAAERIDRIRETTGCDTVVEVRNLFLSASFGGAFGFDVEVRRHADGGVTTAYSQQYRYGADKATIDAFSYDAFAEQAWAALRESAVLDADREARPVDPAAVRAEYDHLAAMWPHTLQDYHLRHILRTTELEASAMIARLHDTNPPSFATLAQQSSQDKASAAKGGDIGWVAQLSLPSEIAAAVRAQNGLLGVVPRPVQADDGWHVIEVLEARPSHAPPFEDVSERMAARVRWTSVVPEATWQAALKQQ